MSEILRGAAAAAESSAFPRLSALGSFARTVDELAPLLAARATLYGIEVQGVVPALAEADAAATRVTLRVGTKRAIRDNARQTTDGDFIDPNTLEVIPGNGPFDYGHKPGFEWWRTQERSRQEGWAREQLREFENDPSHYDIESPSSNRSRQFELPR